MDKFTRNFLTEWRRLRLPFADKSFVLAVSGGADSVSLALAAARLQTEQKLRHKFLIAHYDHNLRGAESARDREFVEDLAGRLKIEFVCRTADERRRYDDGNLEQNARRQRYAFLLETARKTGSGGVLTAHTLNDLAETFLLNLIRGSGIEGLSALKTVRNFAECEDVRLIRPLLVWAKRDDTESFCRKHGIEFRQDAMNDDLDFRRVAVRKKLIPLLAEFNPAIIETVARTSLHLGADRALLDNLLSSDEKFGALVEKPRPEIKSLKELAAPTLQKFLRKWLVERRGDLRRLDATHFRAISDLIHSRKSGKVVELPGFETVRKEKGKLIFQKPEVEK
jgi:tRNA(Ile)-lysidine synthase